MVLPSGFSNPMKALRTEDGGMIRIYLQLPDMEWMWKSGALGRAGGMKTLCDTTNLWLCSIAGERVFG